MKAIRVFLIFLLFAFFGGQACNALKVAKKLLLVDTSQGESYTYRSFMNIAKSVGFTVDYKSIAEISDDKTEELDIEEQDAIFFLFNSQCLLSLTKSEIAAKVLNLIKRFGQNSNKLIGVILPSFRGDASVLDPILEQLDMQRVATQGYPFSFSTDKRLSHLSDLLITKNTIELFNKNLQRFIDVPIEMRTTKYHTTLSPPLIRREFGLELKNITKVCPIALLPIKRNKENSLVPHGIYYFDPKNKNHIFVGSFSALTFAEVAENFRIYPMKHEDRKILLEDLQETLWELYLVLGQKGDNQGMDLTVLSNRTRPELPQSVALLGKQRKQKGRPPLKVAWVEIEIFTKQDEREKQKLLVDYIYKAGLDYLWISISPNMYYSPIGRSVEKKEELLHSISVFTDDLRRKAEGLKVSIPKILIGFEIANNLYNPNLPSFGAKDMYGNEYYDVPAPLDFTFWDNEVIKSFVGFVKDWGRKEISNGVPIDGVVIDLEMYNRKTSAGFISTMGFSNQTFDSFISSNKLECGTQKPWEYLFENRQMSNYFSFLHSQAVRLGEKLKTSFIEQVPGCRIACYAPNININWFYKGLYVGLSGTSENPHNDALFLFTFNSEFESHKRWLSANGINARHFSALMLSKIRSEEDFELAKGDKWLNRFSRAIDPQDSTAWYANEQSPLVGNQFVKFLDHLKTSKED